MLSGPNTGLGHSSIVFMEESQLNYVIEALKFALSTNSLVAPSNDAAVSWTRLVRQKLPDTVWASGCSSWYLNAHGENTTIWPDFTFAFRRATRHFDRADHTISH
jgi:cyclohexanone monooxygenase